MQSACCEGHRDIVRWLLDQPSITPQSDEDTPLRLACWKGHLEVVRMLLADPRCSPASSNNDAIRLACEHGNEQIVTELLGDPRVVPAVHCLYRAIEHGHTGVVKLLLRHIDPSGHYNYSLRFAVEQAHTEIVKLLLADPRVDPSDLHDLAFTKACESGNPEVVRLLLDDSRVSPGRTIQPLVAACAAGHAEIVRMLLADSRILTNDLNYICAKQAAFNGHVGVLKELINDERFKKDLVCKYGLENAARGGSVEVVEYLLEQPETNFDSKETQFALVLAVDNVNTRVVQAFLNDERTKPQARDNWAVKSALYHDGKDIAFMLLKDRRVLPVQDNCVLLLAEKNSRSNYV